jgi:glycosyltransferase involved in cell wall biosynthesis
MVINRLLIISHVIHYQHEGALYAYGPYSREIDIWADLFSWITIAAPLRNEKPPDDCLPFERTNIDLSRQLQRGGNNWREKIKQIVSMPVSCFKLSVSMLKANAVLVRCPGNLGLLGVILAPLFCHFRAAKYAGQWNGYKGEPWSYRFQRSILRSRWWNAPVLVYGEWPNQPSFVIPVFSSILERKHIELAKKCVEEKKKHQPLRILYVGRLSPEKNVHSILDGLKLLQQRDIKFDCRIIGDGLMKPELQQQAEALGLDPKQILVGAMPFEKVLENYSWADVLVLISKTEGFPKAIAEGMAFGLVCIGSNNGLIPKMLAEGRGITVKPGDSTDLAKALEIIAIGERDFSSISHKAAQWGQEFSLEGLRSTLGELFQREWHLDGLELKRTEWERK